ncbi:MAG: T9SS type A sorting domain-containing protein [Flavobacteriales bacterium]|nr:T9SS type A sorting domain-containing protein [Flavobacteriales bacterium]
MKSILTILTVLCFFFNLKGQGTLYVGNILNCSFDYTPDTILLSNSSSVTSGKKYYFDLNQDFLIDIEFGLSYVSGGGGNAQYITVTPFNGNKIACFDSTVNCSGPSPGYTINQSITNLYNFNDTLIRSDLNFSNTISYIYASRTVLTDPCAIYTFNPWIGTGDKYILVSQNNDNEYAWIKLTVTANNKIIIDKFSSSQCLNFQCADNDSLEFKFHFTNNLLDSSGNSNHAIVFNGNFAADKFSNSNEAILINNGGYIEFPYITDMKNNSWTYSLWFNYESLNPFYNSLLYSLEPIKYLFINPADSTIGSTIGSNIVSTSKKVQKNVWNHVAISHSLFYSKIYINGELDTLILNQNFLPNSPNYNLQTENFNGLLDDIRFYNIQLNDSCVRDIFISELGDYIPIVSIDKIKNDISFEVYPNPNDGNFLFRSNELIKDVVFFNSHGEIIRTIHNIDDYQLNISNFSKGFYIIQFISNTQKHYSKTLIIN